MEYLEIKYKAKKHKYNLIFGLVWVALFLIEAIVDSIMYWNLVIGMIYLVAYFFYSNKPYITVKNGVIKQNWIFGKSIPVSEITQIKYFAGDYIIKSNTKELSINTHEIAPDSQAALTDWLRTFQDKWVTPIPLLSQKE
jgi:hypothetical protein